MESVYFMVYFSSAKHPELGTIIEMAFKKGVKYNLFVKISHKGCDSDKGTYLLISCFYDRLCMALKV